MKYALVNPNNQIVAEREDHFIDPTVKMKGGWKWLPIEIVLDDTSTLEYKVVSPVVVTIQPDKVVKTYTTRNMTPAEINAAKTVEASQISDEVLGKLFLTVFRVLYGAAQQIQPGITVQQFVAFVEAEAASQDIPADQFVQWVKGHI